MAAAPAGSRSSKELDSAELQVTVRIKQCPANKESIISKIAESPNMLKLDDEQFTFDYIKWENESQEKIYKAAGYPFVDKALAGFNATILTYGPTDTGKSYTMGSLVSTEINNWKDSGLIQRCLKHVFGENGIQVSASFIEIYDEELHDLLDMGNIVDKGVGSKAKVQEVRSLAEGLQLVNKALQLRKEHLTCRTSLQNISTSQSHALLTLHLKTEHGKKYQESKLNLVDLAGTRITAQKRSVDGGFKSYFEESLSALNKAFTQTTLKKFDLKLSRKKKNVLTSILKELLNVNTHKVSLVACVSSDPASNRKETLETLRIGQCAKNMKIQRHTEALDNLNNNSEPTAGKLPLDLSPESRDTKLGLVNDEIQDPTEKPTTQGNMKSCSVVLKNIDNASLFDRNKEDQFGESKENVSPLKSHETNIEDGKTLFTQTQTYSPGSASTVSISRLPTPNDGHELCSENLCSNSRFISQTTLRFDDSLSMSSSENLAALLRDEDLPITKNVVRHLVEYIESPQFGILDGLCICSLGARKYEDEFSRQSAKEMQSVLLKNVSQLSISRGEEMVDPASQDTEKACSKMKSFSKEKQWFNEPEKLRTNNRNKIEKTKAVVTTDLSLPGQSGAKDTQLPSNSQSSSTKEQRFTKLEKTYGTRTNEAKRMKAILTTDLSLPGPSQAKDSEYSSEFELESFSSQEQWFTQPEKLHQQEKNTKLKRMNSILTTDFSVPVSSRDEDNHSARKIIKLDDTIPVILLNRIPDAKLETGISSAEEEFLDNIENPTEELRNKQRAHNYNILRILNTCDAVELTALPQVGYKTAVIIYQYRLIHGSFKSLKDLENLPTWTKNKSDKFFAANNVLFE